MIIRAKTFKDWMRAHFNKRQLEEIAEHGADAGWSDLTYYSDTSKLYDKFKDELWEVLIECGESGGWTPLQYVEQSRFPFENRTLFENAMVWIAAEMYAAELSEGE